ncbi:MAG: hypothetical protein P1U40_12595 [Coxiellaceae bacterium]|nr:hypothetical protein [Coxiellaceae bacterium]
MQYTKSYSSSNWLRLLLWIAVAFAVYSVVAFYSQPVHNALLYNADALFVPTLYKYLFQQHYHWHDIRGSNMTFLVPDFLLYSVSRFFTSNALQAMTGFALLQTALYAWTVSCFKTFSQRPRSPLFVLAAFISLSLLCFGYLGNELLPTVVAGYHVGLLIVVLLSLWCCCAYLLQPKVWHLLALTALVVASVISDIMYFTSFIAPLFAVLFLSSCIGIVDSQRLKRLSLCLGIAIVLAMLVFYLFPLQFDRKFFNHRGVALVGPLLIFVALYVRQLNKPINWSKRLVAMSVAIVMALLVIGLCYSAYRGTPFYAHTKSCALSYLNIVAFFITTNTMIAAVYAVIMLCSVAYLIKQYRLTEIARQIQTPHQQVYFIVIYFGVMSVAICSLTSIMLDFDFKGVFSHELRHLQVMILTPLFVVLPLMLSNSRVLYRYVSNRWVVALVVAVSALLFWQAPPLNRDNRLHYSMPLAQCLDRHMDQYHLHAGLVSYWQSKPINLFSQRGMRTVAIMQNPSASPKPGHEMLTEYWLNALPPYRQLHFNFIAFGDDLVDANKMRHQFGQPNQRFVCDGNAVWVYADGVLNIKLQPML